MFALHSYSWCAGTSSSAIFPQLVFKNWSSDALQAYATHGFMPTAERHTAAAAAALRASFPGATPESTALCAKCDRDFESAVYAGANNSGWANLHRVACRNVSVVSGKNTWTFADLGAPLDHFRQIAQRIPGGSMTVRSMLCGVRLR